MLIAATVCTAQAEPRQHKHNRNYILRGQGAGPMSGVPTTRRIWKARRAGGATAQKRKGTNSVNIKDLEKELVQARQFPRKLTPDFTQYLSERPEMTSHGSQGRPKQ